MQTELPSLISSDPQTGLARAGKLADQLYAQIDEANKRIERPGGTTYLMPPSMPKEATTSLLFYTIAAANRGWPAL
jgi:hypothetical protein